MKTNVDLKGQSVAFTGHRAIPVPHAGRGNETTQGSRFFGLLQRKSPLFMWYGYGLR